LLIALAFCHLDNQAFAQQSNASSSLKLEATEKESAVSDFLGITYFSFFDGPGLTNETSDYRPNSFGRPSDDGVNFFNLVSFRFKVLSDLAVDLQTRTQWVVNRANEIQNPSEQFRWESPRIGISGRLAGAEEWSLTGALNTDFPYSVPAPFGGGFTTQGRTTLLTPGMFAGLNYRPIGSAWSLFTILSPRYFLYEDPSAAEQPFLNQWGDGRFKPEFVVSLTPNINYHTSEKGAIRVGTTLDYRKLVRSDWNPFESTLKPSEDSGAWRLWPTPVTAGYAYEFSKLVSVYGFLQTFPIEEQRIRSDGTTVSLLDVSSVGFWVSGSLL